MPATQICAWWKFASSASRTRSSGSDGDRHAAAPMSARAYHLILKQARTIAGLAGSGMIQPTHLAKALQYRRKENSQHPKIRDFVPIFSIFESELSIILSQSQDFPM